MSRMNVVGVGLVVLACALLPPNASAQQASGIAGVVRDTSGAVLPGVTVEAASPVLIEKVRTVVSDGEGRYNIVDLRPGNYVVTFTLAGFNTFRRDGIGLTAGFTATVNADMQVGSLEETITVTGAAPLVDTQNVRQQTAVSNDLRTALPSGTMGLMGVATLIPGMTSGTDPGGGGTQGIYSANQTTASNFHGKAGSKQSFDGMQTNNLSGEGSSSYMMNPVTVQETVVETGGISAESNASGLLINMVPKDGSNDFRFETTGTYTNENLQTSTLSARLVDRGVTTPSKVLYAYDFNFAVGGPIRRDRLWFFTATRLSATKNQIAGLFFNKTQGTPLYTADLTRPQFAKEWLQSQALRITWQASPKNKVNAFADPQYFQTRGGSNAAPEAQGCLNFWPQGLYQGSWSSPATNKLLLEGGVSLTKGPFPCTSEDVTELFGFTVKPTDISILEASTNFRYNAAASYLNSNDHDRYAERFSVSYVTGSHSLKTGLQLQQHVHNDETVVNTNVNYTFRNAVPTLVTQWATPYHQRHRTKADLGLFVQDQWAVKRLTLNYGLRFDYFNGYVPANHIDAAQFVGARDFDKVECIPCWTDLNPRIGVSYDLFGSGRTALKTSLGRYVGRETTVFERANDPVATSVNSANRTWNDANKDYIPNCDLSNFAANGECAAIDNVNFGKTNPSAIRYADDLIHGFGNREYFWDYAAEVQHELRQGVSLKGGYYRNWTDHFGALPRGENTVGVADNQAVTPTDFSPYCITAPVDPRLPGGGGYQVCGLYDISPEKFGQGQIVVGRAGNYDEGKSRVSNFVTASVTTRLGGGKEFGASVDTGRTVEDLCFVVDSPQYSYPVSFAAPAPLLNCRVVNPFKGQTQLKMNGVYPLPGGFVVSAVYQNLSGVSYDAYYTARNSEIAPSLGRNLGACGAQAVCSATVIVSLIPTKTQFEPRRNLLDLRFTKVFSVGPKARLRANVDLYNVLNDIAILAINSTYGAQWKRPVGRGLASNRLLQFGGTLTF